MERGLVEERIQEMMRDSGALLEGHFLLTSGLHSAFYLQCALLLRFPAYAAFAGKEIARLVQKLQPTVVVAPAIGGLIIGHEVARALDIPFIFCEREDGKMRLRRFPFPEKAGVVVVEDVITTGVCGRGRHPHGRKGSEMAGNGLHRQPQRWKTYFAP